MNEASRKHPVGSTLKVFGERLYRVAGNLLAPNPGAGKDDSGRIAGRARSAKQMHLHFCEVKNPSEQLRWPSGLTKHSPVTRFNRRGIVRFN